MWLTTDVTLIPKYETLTLKRAYDFLRKKEKIIEII